MLRGYGDRLLSIFIPSLDRMDRLIRGAENFSIVIHGASPSLLGIGMGNYQPEMSYTGLVTHNSYTQVAAEMG